MNGDNVCERERERVATVRPGDSQPVPVSGEERCQLPGKTVREQDSREAGQTGLVVILIATRLRMAPWHISCSVNHRSLYHCIPVSLYHCIIVSCISH